MYTFKGSGRSERAKAKAASKSGGKSAARVIFTGAAAGFAATVAFIALFALVMLLFKMDRRYAALFATLSVAAGSFISALYVGRRVSMKGIFSGALTGFCFFAAVTAASLAVDDSGVGANTVFHLVIILLSGAIGGIVGANRKRRPI